MLSAQVGLHPLCSDGPYLAVNGVAARRAWPINECQARATGSGRVGSQCTTRNQASEIRRLAEVSGAESDDHGDHRPDEIVRAGIVRAGVVRAGISRDRG